jgi:hypothetical protein
MDTNSGYSVYLFSCQSPLWNVALEGVNVGVGGAAQVVECLPRRSKCDFSREFSCFFLCKKMIFMFMQTLDLLKKLKTWVKNVWLSFKHVGTCGQKLTLWVRVRLMNQVTLDGALGLVRRPECAMMSCESWVWTLGRTRPPTCLLHVLPSWEQASTVNFTANTVISRQGRGLHMEEMVRPLHFTGQKNAWPLGVGPGLAHPDLMLY